MDDIIRELQEELNYQKNLMKKLDEELATLPPGSLCIKMVNGNEYVYMQQYKIDKDGKKKSSQRCVPKKETQLAEKILRRRFAEISVIKLGISTKQLEIFIEKYKPYSATEIYKTLSKAYIKFDISGYLSNKEMEIMDWDENFKKIQIKILEEIAIFIQRI